VGRQHHLPECSGRHSRCNHTDKLLENAGSFRSSDLSLV
jgi:hypothetical protein